jgi:hypothetical protein
MKSWLSRFNWAQNDVERALRRKPALPAPDADLHDSIMRAVRAACREEQTPRRPSTAWMAAWALGISVAALAVGLWLRPPVAPPASKAMAARDLAGAPGAALELGSQLPDLLMAPLSNELARVDHDLHQTTEALLASFP